MNPIEKHMNQYEYFAPNPVEFREYLESAIAYARNSNKNLDMDLRDYFAAKAMQAIMANDTLLMDCSAYKDDHSEIRIAAYAYKHADAMMKAREK